MGVLIPTDLGYKILSKAFFPPKNTEQSDVPIEADPRGLFRAGMVPAKRLSYRISFSTIGFPVSSTSSIVRSFGSLLGGLGGGFASNLAFLPEEIQIFTNVQAAVMVFRGIDVIDLPTSNLERDGNAIIVPDNVFLPLHAGMDRFIQDGDSIAAKAALSLLGGIDGNLVVQTMLSEGAPKDVLGIKAKSGRSFVDAASNRIIVSGDPEFISYVAAMEPLFRDVIFLTIATSTSGVASSTSGFLASNAIPISIRASVARFAFINVANPGEEKRMQWRLSESYGLDSKSELINTPIDLREQLTNEERILDDISSSGMHFVYDLNDSGEDLSREFGGIALKPGVSPALAVAKQDPNSPFFDEAFLGVSLGIVPGLGSSGLLAENGSADVLQSGLVETMSQYTSPTLDVSLPQDARIGLEYIRSNNLGQQRILLAKTKASVPGVAAIYDSALFAAIVYDTATAIGNDIITERFLDDFSWIKFSSPSFPTGKLDSFLVGENPLRSLGRAIILPEESILEDVIDDSEIMLPSKSLLTKLEFQADGRLMVLGFNSKDTSGDPVFEADFENDLGAAMLSLEVSPLKVQLLDVSGGITSRVAGVMDGDVVLPKLPSGNDNTASELQTRLVDDMIFPVSANSISACNLSSKIFVAYQHEDRIDLAIKNEFDGKFDVIRDIVLRVPSNFNEDEFDEDSIPSANLPFVMCDSTGRTLLLLYEYKSRLLLKKVPIEIFDAPRIGQDRRYSTEDEKALIQTMHSLGAVVVYNGDGESEESGIKADIMLGAILANKQSTTGTRSALTQYSACMDAPGYLYVFINASNKFFIRRSNNMGATWEDAWPSALRFLPIPMDDPTNNNMEAEAPSCLYDSGLDVVHLFFFAESALLVRSIPGETLRKEQDVLASEIMLIPPVFMVGSINIEDAKSRGILGVSSEVDIKTPALTPHRIGTIITAQGYIRVFFKDDQERLKSIISTNNGSTWLSEKQFVGGENGS